MTTQSVHCNNCGAPLSVPPEANFVTCNHCGTALAVKRNESVAYTEALERIDRRTEEIAGQVSELSREAELARIDREWDQERERYMVSNKEGHRHVPSPVGSLVGAVIMAVFGVGWTAFAASMRGSGFFPCFGLVFIGAAVYMGIVGFTKASQYEEAHRRYRSRRAAALRGRDGE